MKTRTVTRKGTVMLSGNEFEPCEPDILLRKVGAGSRVLVMEDAFPEAVAIFDQSPEFLCNAYIPEFFLQYST